MRFYLWCICLYDSFYKNGCSIVNKSCCIYTGYRILFYTMTHKHIETHTHTHMNTHIHTHSYEHPHPLFSRFHIIFPWFLLKFSKFHDISSFSKCTLIVHKLIFLNFSCKKLLIKIHWLGKKLERGGEGVASLAPYWIRQCTYNPFEKSYSNADLLGYTHRIGLSYFGVGLLNHCT